MSSQDFFYIVTGSAIILIAIFICLVLIYWLIVLKRIAKIVDRVDKLVKTLKEKIKISAFIGLISQGIKETVELIKEKRGKK